MGTPCRDCGGAKPPRRKVCDPCRDLLDPIKRREAAAEARAAAAANPARAKRVHASRAPAGQKWCAQCQTFKPFRQFQRRRSYCRPCLAEYSHDAMVLKTYGITGEQYAAMLADQGGACAICLLKKRPRLAVDHNHKTGEVRGLLCKMCNGRMLTSARDDPATLRRAADYLENPPARRVLRAA